MNKKWRHGVLILIPLTILIWVAVGLLLLQRNHSPITTEESPLPTQIAAAGGSTQAENIAPSAANTTTVENTDNAATTQADTAQSSNIPDDEANLSSVDTTQSQSNGDSSTQIANTAGDNATASGNQRAGDNTSQQSDDDTSSDTTANTSSSGQNTTQAAITQQQVTTNAQAPLPGPPRQDTGGRNETNVSTDLNRLVVEFQAFQNQGGAEFRATNNAIPLSNTASDDPLVTIDAIATGDANTLLNDLQALGLQDGAVFGRVVSGRLPMSAIGRLNTVANMNFIRPAYAMANVGQTTSQGDAAQNSDDARDMFGVDGSGVKVGVLSDSYDCLGGAASDRSNNDVPTVTVLDDLSGSDCSFAGDEGRAMIQLIHDTAPGARQSFHTAFNGMADFADGIVELKNNGANVIVDDILYFAEPMFQDGIVAQAVDQVVADGVAYFSSAGNSARQSYESAFTDSGNFGCFGNRHDFDPGAGSDTLQEVTIPVNTSITIVMQWDQPFLSASETSAGSASDIDIILLNATAPQTGCPTANRVTDAFGFFVQGATGNIGGDAVEIMSFTNFASLGYGETFNIAIENFSGPNPGIIKYVEFRGAMTVDEYATNSPTSYGHANAAGAEAVGAAFYGDTPAFGQVPPLLESFSSAGGVPILFDINGDPITPILRDKPEIVAPDGTNTTFFGADIEPDGFPNFFGTSAAAPHAAGVAALMLDANSSLTPAEIYDTLEMTAIDMDVAGFDNDTGYGLIDAQAAVEQILVPSAPPLTMPENKALSSDNTPDFSWESVANAVSYEIEIDDDKGFNSPDQTTIVNDTMYTATTLGDGKYFWRVRGINGAGMPGAWSNTFQFTIDTTPPDVPIIESPDGATVENTRVQLKWNKNKDAAMYELRLDTVNAPVFTIESRKNKYKPPSELLPTTYFWQVRAIDKAGNASAWTPIQTLNVISSNKSSPILNRFTTATPTLTWNPISWATEYEIQIDISKKFNTSVVQTHTVTAPTTTLVPDPLADGVWLWRIRARDAGGTWGKWSSPETILIDS